MMYVMHDVCKVSNVSINTMLAFKLFFVISVVGLLLEVTVVVVVNIS